MTMTLLASMAASTCSIPPALAPRCVVTTRVCSVSRLTPSTTTRLRIGSAAMTLPLTPRSSPAAGLDGAHEGRPDHTARRPAGARQRVHDRSHDDVVEAGVAPPRAANAPE